jgi:hypothetical protein
VGEQPTPQGEPSTQPPVVSHTGRIVVRTTERGLPTQLTIAASEMSRAPEDLAREILLLCRLSAKRLQVARRRDLQARGFSSEVLRGLQLTTEEELASAEEEARGDDDGLPETLVTSP